MLDLSVVVPAFNEDESLPELLLQIQNSVKPLNITYEVLVIDDGSNDNTMSVLRDLKAKFAFLRVLSFRKNYGKSAALSVGFKSVKGRFIITMDADLQDDPNEIPNLLAKLEEGYDMVSGWKKVRHDPISKTIPSKFFNYVTSKMSGIRLHDFNCGLKAYRREVVDDMNVYGELHRFLPVLAHWSGFRVTEIVVTHHARKYGKTKFGLSRFFNGFFDLATVMFITRYKTSPLHIFGLMGLFSSLLGIFIELYLTMGWFMGERIRNRPLFFLGILAIIVGIQFFVFGLIGEMISANFAERVDYSIKERID